MGIAIYQSKALFKGFCRLSLNFNFIKRTLHNQQQKFQRMNSPIVLDGLHNSRCDSFCCVHVILDGAKICTQGFHHFLHFGKGKTYSSIKVSLLP